MRRSALLLVALLVTTAIGWRAFHRERHVGPIGQKIQQADSSVTEGVGTAVTMHSRPVDVSVSPNRRFAAVKDDTGVKLVDLGQSKVVSGWKSPDGTSSTGLCFRSEDLLLTTTAGHLLVELKVSADGQLSEQRRIDVSDSYPSGIAVLGSSAFVALSTKNQIAEVDLDSGKVLRTLSVGIAPFQIAVDPVKRRLFVSEQGGLRPTSTDLVASSAGTPVKVDQRGILASGALAQVDLGTWSVATQTPLPTLPSSVVFDAEHHLAVVACANGDRLICIDADSGKSTQIQVASGKDGAFPTGLCLSDHHLYSTLAGMNGVLELDWRRGRWTISRGLPTDWYPVAVADDADNLVIANTKGFGSRSPGKPGVYNSYDFTGTVRIVAKSLFGPPIPSPRESYGRRNYPPIRHVVYVIKENRTYDQLFGDMSQADGDPKLCQFGLTNTPNQHAIASTWVLLDNYYCSGVLSADGHSWATEGNSTPYLERSFGGFKRSYTFGDDPLTYSSTGFIWDAVLAKGLDYRNYGEFDYAEPVEKIGSRDLYNRSLQHTPIELKENVGVQRVKDHSCPNYPGWNLNISDQYRMDRFEEEFTTMKSRGQMPSFLVVYLPQDHTGGPVAPQSHVADNDLAVGRLIDDLSHSPFWNDTVVFVTEDDPQAGTDHVDGHRSICLIAGGRVQRGKVIHDFHTQASVLHTICDLFGVPPLNQKTALAPPIDEVFQSNPDPTPFTALPETVSLSELPKSRGLYARTVRHLDLRTHEVQTYADMDALNRALWAETRPGEAYPSPLAGAHGRGLASRGLEVDHGSISKAPDDDD
jgi:hypothetical protein